MLEVAEMSMLDDEYDQSPPEDRKGQKQSKSSLDMVLGKGTTRKPSKAFSQSQDPIDDDINLDNESQSIIASVGKVKQLSELEGKISDLRKTVSQLKKQYDIYKNLKELLEDARQSKLFSQAELEVFDDLYRKEKTNLVKKVDWSMELIKDLRMIYSQKQKLIVGLARSKALPVDMIKLWEHSLQKSDIEISKHTKFAVYFQTLFPKK
jgi:hypothetical protein